MATTRLYLDRRGKAKDGKGNIIITLYHNGTTASIPTGIRVYPHNWSDGRIVKCDEASALNAKLQEQKNKVDKMIAMLSLDDNFEKMTATGLKEKVRSNKVVNRGHLISDVFKEYTSSGDLKQGTVDIYDTCIAKVLTFAGRNFTIESVTLRWLRQFDRFLSQTQGVNGRAIYLRALRAVCNYALHTGMIQSYPFANFQIKQEQTMKRSVSVELLRRFRDYPTTPKNAMFRDYFFLMFYLIGINSKDLLLAKKSQVIDGRLVYIREKTGKKYSVKIEPEAEALLQRYEGKGDCLLEWKDHRVHYKNFVHEMNDALKKIGDMVEEEIPDMDDLFAETKTIKRVEPVIPGISTYYARHTWATLAYEIGIQMDTISQALGHSFGNRTTLIYVKPSQEKVDIANRMVIDYLSG